MSSEFKFLRIIKHGHNVSLNVKHLHQNGAYKKTKTTESQTCFIPFNTAWTFSFLAIGFCFWSCASVPPNKESEASGEETGVWSGSDDLASKWVELEIPWNWITVSTVKCES